MALVRWFFSKFYSTGTDTVHIASKVTYTQRVCLLCEYIEPSSANNECVAGMCSVPGVDN